MLLQLYNWFLLPCPIFGYIVKSEECGNVDFGSSVKVTAKGAYFMALSAWHVTAIFSATWSPSGDLGPRSTPIRSILAALLALSPSATAPVLAAGRCWGTWACLGQRMFYFAGRLRNRICGWSSLLICVSGAHNKSRMLIHVSKVLRLRFAAYWLR